MRFLLLILAFLVAWLEVLITRHVTSTGANVKIGYGCRVKEAIILDNTVLDVRYSAPSLRTGKVPR